MIAHIRIARGVEYGGRTYFDVTVPGGDSFKGYSSDSDIPDVFKQVRRGLELQGFEPYGQVTFNENANHFELGFEQPETPRVRGDALRAKLRDLGVAVIFGDKMWLNKDGSLFVEKPDGTRREYKVKD